MLIDYRVYCTLYAVLFLTYLIGFPLTVMAGGKYFYRYVAVEAFAWAAVGLTNYLDWLWS